MSITVSLKRITNLPGRYDRKVELSFRGFTHKTKILQCENLAIFNEQFRWPHYGKGIGNEVLTISVYNCSKVFSNRLLGKLVVGLQHVVTSGRMVLRERLTAANYSLTDMYVELDIRYQPVQGSAGGWEGDEFLDLEDGDESGLVIRNTAFADAGPKQALRPEHLDRAARRIGRGLLRTGDEDDEDDDDDDDDFDMDSMETSNMTFTPILSRCRALSRHGQTAIPRVQSFQVNVSILEAQKLQGVNINPAVFIRVEKEKRHTATQKSTNCPFYNENFVFEFHETQDVLFDKVIEMTVVNKKLLGLLMKRIGMFKIDISTVYSQPDHSFHQKWAPLTDPSDTRSGIRGYVKASITVVRKGDDLSIPSTGAKNDEIDKNLLLPRGMPAERPWAQFLVRVYRAEGLPSMSAGFLGNFSKMMDRNVFIDPYVQVTFAGQQGETSVVSGTNSPTWNEQISFIEQFPPLARRIKIQILDDANIGDVAVATHFLDLQQISDPTRNGFDPTFGPSWINLYGSPRNSALRDVHQAMNEGLSEGIFYRGRLLLGLSVEVYTSPNSAAADTQPSPGVKGALGRLKRKSKKTKERKQDAGSAVESEEAGMEVPEAVTVEVKEVHPMPEGLVGEKEEFLLFASFFEITMMDPVIGSKSITFELSIGNYGKVVEVAKSKKSGSKEELSRSRDDLRRNRDDLRRSREDLSRSRDDVSVGMEDLSDDGQPLLGSEDELERGQLLDPGPLDRSVSKPRKPQPTELDRSFRCVPLKGDKPCLYLWCCFEDHSFRYYSSNWLHKIADRLEIGLEEVEGLLKRPRSRVKERLVEVLTEFVASCKQYCSNAFKKGAYKPNNLDKRRREFLRKRILLLARAALRARRRVTRRTAPEKLSEAQKIFKKLLLLAKEPQSTLPDVFLWMLSAGRRLAYCRIPSHSILFSLVEEQRGKDCGKLSTIYMKTPGGPVGEIFAKLEVYLWLGITKYAKNCTISLPGEFLPVCEPMPAGVPMPANMPPISLTCQDSRYFQLRCHMYQARGIIASDDTGLSDPFTKVLFSTQCQVSRILNQTLSPTWCELLLFDRVLIEGTKEELRDDPPIIIISLYDFDAMSKNDPLGRAFAEPELKFVEEPYKKPGLKFFNITRGRSHAGQLLAAFELIELDYSCFGEPSLNADVDPQEPQFLEEERCYVIPEGVRPVLKTFRIEVLFWGLRDLCRVNLFEVERPQVRIECAGHCLESEEMENYKVTPNFKEIVRHFHVELPEQVYLHPPLTIFVLEQRAFGRMVLVGTHVVQSLMAFGPQNLGDWDDEEEEEPKRPVKLSIRKTTPLVTMKTMQLGNLPIKMSKIPINLETQN
ncbi:fer-1-like protein 4 [Hypomesus transpacificus]|uniref:fer-1-like protein 4 n=1 Tax=Hypomesus transpacificus TaxID=137520 RepID=UPI001F082A06|nr:fer-1-like protein 4 [Hypomesus transpacificus]